MKDTLDLKQMNNVQSLSYWLWHKFETETQENSFFLEEPKLYHSQFQNYFLRLEAQFEALLQILAHHLRRRSSHYLLGEMHVMFVSHNQRDCLICFSQYES